jgi:cytochrome c oxidase cbb3-type subunit 3
MTTEALPPKGPDEPSADAHDHDAAEAQTAPPTPPPTAETEAEGHGGDPNVVHAYDDIQEYDNHLPNWWLYILYGTMAFGLLYFIHYHVLRTGESARAAYEREMQADWAAAAERARSMSTMTNEALLTLSRDAHTVAEGQQIFAQNCVACHAANAAGNIGPNLTDAYWLHGGAPTAIYRTVTEGVPARGMLAWGPQLGSRRVQSVVAYLLTIKNTNVAGRPPQGNREP